MNDVKETSSLNGLYEQLLSVLDETVFFSKLSSYLQELLPVDAMYIHRINEDNSFVLVSENGIPVENAGARIEEDGVICHVTKSKRAYFSNNVKSDPIFYQVEEGVEAELCIPVVVDGMVIAVINFQYKTKQEFNRDNINTVLGVLNYLRIPLVNMKMYLAAKSLNEVLLKRIEEKERELRDRNQLMPVDETFKIVEDEILGISKQIKRVLELVDRISLSNENVLIQGEVGIGKESIARRIHCRSPRKDRAFIVVDCSSTGEFQLERELFGEDASISGTLKSGYLEIANGGTLFLDRVSFLSNNLQSKLYTFIKNGMGLRVGGLVPFRSDVRIIASATDTLQEEVGSESFRREFYYAISSMIIKVPPLRERKEDIEVMANYFLKECSKDGGGQKFLTPGVIRMLSEYSWPGNIRELKNVIRRTYILSNGMIIDKLNLEDANRTLEVVRAPKKDKKIDYKTRTLNEVEKEHICETLEFLNGNKTKTAKFLGITVKTLYNKLHNYGLIKDTDINNVEDRDV